MSARPICATGKRCFNSERGARIANRGASFRIRCYACDECGYLHVANGDKRPVEHDEDVKETHHAR